MAQGQTGARAVRSHVPGNQAFRPPGAGHLYVFEIPAALEASLWNRLMPVETLTPLMRQYHALKARHPGELLFFHLGDFYELFGDDAKRAAPLLGVALTHRQDVPMCGVPVHAADAYVAKLLKAGLRVAMAD